jgi:hypothetical protein
MLRSDSMLATSAASGKSTEAIFGIGCALAVGITILICGISYAACK